VIFLSKWYRLDNAAKIFPPSRSKNDYKVFRFSVTLLEPVKVDILNKALDETLEEYPIFKSSLKKGIFWYYLEEVNKNYEVKMEDKSPCSKISNNNLFEVSVYKNRINLEVDHALTDGTGTLTFLKSLVANYLNSLYNIKNNEVINEGSIKEIKEDAFKKYKDSNFKKVLKSKRAYRIKDEKYIDNRLKVIEGIVSIDDIKVKAKEFDLTITEYLTSVLIKSIGEVKNKSKKPIVITIPVNLRKYYPTYTVRNFFSVVNIDYLYNNDTFRDIAKSVKNKFKEKLDKENIKDKMNSMIKLEDIFIVRLIPVFIKDFVLKIACNIENKYQTMTLSNIGIINMPDVYKKYIDYFSVFTSTSKIQMCMCSYKDKMVISFSSKFVNSEIEKNFFKFLSKDGTDVIINTNDYGDCDE